MIVITPASAPLLGTFSFLFPQEKCSKGKKENNETKKTKGS